MGRADAPMPCLVCDRPYEPSRAPTVGVAVEHVDDLELRVVLGVCSACVAAVGLPGRVIHAAEAMLGADPGCTRVVGAAGHA